MNRGKVLSVNLVFLITVIFSIFGAFLNSFISLFTDNYFILLLSSQIILIIPSLIYIIKNDLNLSKTICIKSISFGNTILLILFSYLIMPLMTFINALSMIFVDNSTADFMENIVGNNGLFLSLFIVAFIPAILEETVYRGIFYNEYRKVSPLKAIFLSAFLFGIIHLNLNQFTYAFAMGVVFALIIEATDSILSTMIIHFFINGTSVITLYVLPYIMNMLEKLMVSMEVNPEEHLASIESGVDEIINFPFVMKTYFLPAIISTILAFVVYRTIAKNSNRWEHVKNIFTKKTKGGKLRSGSLIVAIVICIVLMIVQELVIRLN